MKPVATRQFNEARNFRKQVIMPTIYDIDNIKLIQAHKYPTSPTSNALQAKKLELSNKIAQIVSNPKLQLFKSAVTLQSQLNSQSQLSLSRRRKSVQTKGSKRPSTVLLRQKTEDDNELVLQVDEINPECKMSEQQCRSFQEKTMQLLQKVGDLGMLPGQRAQQKDVDFYLKYLAKPGAKSVREVSTANAPEIEQDLRAIAKISSKRFKSVFCRASCRTPQHKYPRQASRLSHYQVGSDRLLNTHCKSKNGKSLQQVNRLIENIEKSIKSQELQKSSLLRTMRDMQKQLQQSTKKAQNYGKPNRKMITSMSLSLLREKRIRTDFIAAIDRQFNIGAIV